MCDTKETRVCVDCQAKVSNWFTTHTDKDPRCETCSVEKFKRDNPATWNLKLKTKPPIPPVVN